MAKLEQLLPVFHLLDDASRLELIRKYRSKRNEDIDKYTNSPAKKTATRKAGIQLSDEEKDLMKRIGISTKQLSMLKMIEPQAAAEETDDEEDDALFEE